MAGYEPRVKILGASVPRAPKLGAHDYVQQPAVHHNLAHFICHPFNTDSDTSLTTYLGTTVFRGMQNFELSCGICPFPRNFYVFAKFCGIRYHTGK